MITEDFVNYNIANLLKEKGFDEEIETLITPTGKIYFLDENSVEKTPHKTICNSQINTYSNDVSCPTLQMAMKWLREVHNLHIDVDPSKGNWNSTVLELEGWSCAVKFEEDIPIQDSYEEACEAAIKYCLVNLI